MIIGWRSESEDEVKYEGNLGAVEGGTSNGGWWVEMHVSPEPAQLTIFGGHPSTKNVIQPIGADLVIAGGTPTVRNNTTVWPTGAEIIITGGSPSLGQTFEAEPIAAALTVAGGRPSLKETIRPTGATVQVAGGTPVVSFEQLKLQPTAANLTITGGQPSIKSVIRPTGATVSIAGSSPRLQETLRPTGATLTVVGGTPLVIYQPVDVEPTGANLAIVGGRPSLKMTVCPTGAQLTVAGSAPVVHNNVTARPTGAEITITGGQPPLRSTVRPTGATLTITGGVPDVQATSPLVVVGSNSMANYYNSGSNSIAIPAHQIGDEIVIVGMKGSGAAAPPSAGGTVPSWSLIDDPTSAPGMYVASHVATATNTTSGTWTADALAVIVLRYQKSSGAIGAHANQLVTSGTVDIAPALSLTNTDGTSVVLQIFGAAACSGWAAAPAGWTRLTSANYSSNQPGICVNVKNDTTTSPVATSQGTIYTSGLGPFYARGESLEILKH